MPVFLPGLLMLVLGGCGGEPEVYDLNDMLKAEAEKDAVVVPATGAEGIPGEASRDGEAISDLIYVYVCGAVERPGVVELARGSRAEAGVAAAGGMREDADPDYVNLAAVLADGEKLYIPTKEEGVSLRQRESASPLVNINTADSGTLCTLPGIGESRAADIISYREANGGFSSIEEIMNVPGIKDNAFQKIKDLITV